MFVLMLSIFVANVANIIDVDSHALNKATTVEGMDEVKSRWSNPKKYNINDSPDNLLWFLQVSHPASIYHHHFYLFKQNNML